MQFFPSQSIVVLNSESSWSKLDSVSRDYPFRIAEKTFSFQLIYDATRHFKFHSF